MMDIKCIIIDDEQLARNLLTEYVSKVPQLTLIGQFRNPLEAMDTLSENKVDLIFLDIQMPNLTGVEFLKNSRPDAAIVFTTAYSEYALEGYDLDITDYLLKPFSFERFVQCVNKTIKSVGAKKNIQIDREQRQFITVNSEHKIYKIILDEIDYIEGLKEYVSFYVKGQRIITLVALKYLESVLPKGEFMRVHRSYIVPTRKVDVLEGNQLRIKDKLIPIGRSYKEEVVSNIFESS